MKIFKVESLKFNKIRLYSQVICLTNSNIDFRNRVLENIYKNENNAVEFKMLSENFPLVIKRYNKGKTFSKFIHNEKNDDFIISGPNVSKN